VREGLDLIFGGVRRLRLGGGSSSLRIGCDVTFGISWLGPRIGRFMERYPEIEVGMDLADPGPDPTWRTVDATIHFGYGRFPKYEAIRLTTESLFPVCAPTYLSSNSPADLLRCSLLHVPWLEPDTIFGTFTWHSWFAQAGIDTHGVKLSGVHLSHTANALQLAMSGRGVALASDCLTADAITSGSLVRPIDIRLPLPRNYYLVYSESIASLEKIAAFRDWLLSETAPFR
jgi:LysR family glycine cleavage system transcriptional activator